ncbi:MAG: hypothetical protein CMJ32_02515 [Phycisphaerae bacterium]|nr:hypothetical protein [Phycisphaerae bacterium]
MDLEYTVISIGQMSANPLWNERTDVRPGHATTTLVRSEEAVILVDPSLPCELLVPRLADRANLKPDQVTHVFLTCYHPEMRRGIEAFDSASWLISEHERETVGVGLIEKMEEAQEHDDQDLVQVLKAEIDMLRRTSAAPDSIAEGIDLFPLHGVTPGLTGLLLTPPSMSLLVTGDAIPTFGHLQQGKVLPHCADLEKAKESFAEAVEIADAMVLGRDNLVLNPIRRPF